MEMPTCVGELICAGVDPNVKDKLGKNPLLEASQRGNADVIAAHRADADVAINNENPPLHRSVVVGHIDVVNINLLLAHGARLDLQNAAGKTPLHENPSAVFWYDSFEGNDVPFRDYCEVDFVKEI
ncbi:hypothetical protein Ae201684P_012250 [Aphanomyces euteiches]|uniref:Uncharacterized protein n=1 Tax=Aphanomyces euteiches TaxID=100861 RepID=A0A6G0WB05_9STRA|nr:hypothetical protein Ae201684_017437 [Aphanomyces euteiches]KAH9088963.1 hypothetical protein Ae201684P_012250 [Aphanomyces euteiches]KAH9135350.1 hypothetical protein AeRB84_019206 [Aphanomyces euteiches]KAH9148971.1 hypothetical protein AeRB84_007830 [Aphanomyces euteiches]